MQFHIAFRIIDVKVSELYAIEDFVVRVDKRKFKHTPSLPCTRDKLFKDDGINLNLGLTPPS